jgi:hypothetical protein
MMNVPTDQTLKSYRLAERYAHFFDRPDVRLRFLNNTLARQTRTRERVEIFLEKHPFAKKKNLHEPLLKLWLYHLIFQEVGRQLPATSKGRRILSLRSRAPFAARVCFVLYRFQKLTYAAAAVCAAALIFGVSMGAVWSAHRAVALISPPERVARADKAQASAPNSVYAQTIAASLPEYSPEKVWLVEQKDNYERYSNGARVLRDYETANHRRGYYVYKPGAAEADATPAQEPVGIVYHTSESDLLPFDASNSESIETHTRGLLEYVKRNSSYNYVIDRFGQIYRVVRDEDAANHAGNSVWAGPQGLYVGLNESFLGVCFETRTAAGEDERLTEAQLVSGRLLTQVLRSRYQIDDANCVTHGLVSVNPSNMLICFHHDWARGFPFETMGLSDKYQVAPASVGEFGFTYDADVKALVGGELWPGVAAAEAAFASKAEGAGLDPEEMRRRTREQYRRQMDAQKSLRASLGGGHEAGAD